MVTLYCGMTLVMLGGATLVVGDVERCPPTSTVHATLAPTVPAPVEVQTICTCGVSVSTAQPEALTS